MISIVLFVCVLNSQTVNSGTKVNQPSDSLYSLGVFYLYQDTDTPNYNLAQRYLEQAAQMGNTRALSLLGHEYLLGGNLSTDTTRGLLLLRRAAELGESYALCSMGEYFYLKHDIAQAELMLIEARSMGNTYAMMELFDLYYNGYAFSRIERTDKNLVDHKKGFTFLLEAAEMKNPRAQLRLAYQYAKDDTIYPDRNMKLARLYWQQALGNPVTKEIPGFKDEIEIAKTKLGL